MNMTHDEMIAVIAAHRDGKVIQYRPAGAHPSRIWTAVSLPIFDFSTTDYRIKPEPIEGWVNVYPNGRMGKLYATEADAENGMSGELMRRVFIREVES